MSIKVNSTEKPENDCQRTCKRPGFTVDAANDYCAVPLLAEQACKTAFNTRSLSGHGYVTGIDMCAAYVRNLAGHNAAWAYIL